MNGSSIASIRCEARIALDDCWRADPRRSDILSVSSVLSKKKKGVTFVHAFSQRSKATGR